MHMQGHHDIDSSSSDEILNANLGKYNPMVA
jgi:hypothetical protein